MLGEVAEVVAVISIIGHFYQHSQHKTQETIMLGFLHGLKPNIESASQGHSIPSHTWAGVVNQINDMLGRLQPPVSPWKRLVVRTFAWGVGCGLALSLVFLSVDFYTQRPRGWDTHALRVKNAKAEALSLMDEHLAEKSIGTILTVDLENTTRTDITLPQTLTVMQATKGTGALHGSMLKLPKEYFVPAFHVVSITLENDDLCAAEVEPQSCFTSYFKDQGEIVLFDDTSKYEIRIPMPTFTAPKSGSGPINPIQNQ